MARPGEAGPRSVGAWTGAARASPAVARVGRRPTADLELSSSSKSAVGRLPTRATAGDALAAPVHAPTLRGPASPARATHPPPRANGRRDGGAATLRQPTSRPHASRRSPTDPALRANPFPEVTDPFCRLPLPTLFHRLEAVHLGDLMRISVRPGARITRSLGFSRAVGSAPDARTGSAPDATTSVTLYRAQHPLSSQPDSRGPAR